MSFVHNNNNESQRLLQQLLSEALNEARGSNVLNSEALQQLDPELFTRSMQTQSLPSTFAPQRLYQSGREVVLQRPSNEVVMPQGTYTGSYKRPERGKPEYADFPILPSGEGTMVYRAGYKDFFYPKSLSKYEGHWAIREVDRADKSEYNGYGVLTFTDGTTMRGDWINGRLFGNGIIKFPDGNGICGTWYNGILRKGIQFLPNGDIYRGSFTPMNLDHFPIWEFVKEDEPIFYDVPENFTPFAENDWVIQKNNGYLFKHAVNKPLYLNPPGKGVIDSFKLHELSFPIKMATGVFKNGYYTEISHPPEESRCCSIL